MPQEPSKNHLIPALLLGMPKVYKNGGSFATKTCRKAILGIENRFWGVEWRTRKLSESPFKDE
jgi:hypothetical protein